VHEAGDYDSGDVIDDSGFDDQSSLEPSAFADNPDFDPADADSETATGDESVIPPGQPGGPGYDETEDAGDYSVIPPGQPGGPGYEETDASDQSVIPPGQPGGPGYEETDASDQSVIPPGQPGGPGYEADDAPVATEEPQIDYDDDGNPSLVDAPADGDASVGTWWTTAAPVTQCCAPLPDYTQEGDDPSTGLTFAYDQGQDQLTGHDSNGDGIVDFSPMDATQTGQIDTWLADTDGDGIADRQYFDADGDGLPDAVSTDLTGTGNWSEPELLPQAGTLSVIPPGQPGGPDPVATALAGYTAGPGVDLATVCSCTSDPTSQQAVARIATVETARSEVQAAPVSDDTTGLDPSQSVREVSTDDPSAVATADVADLTQQGLPDTWQQWAPPTEADPASYTDQGYSTDWGQVTPEWSSQGEDPFPTTEPDQPLTTLVGPGHTEDVWWAAQGQTNYCGIYSVRAVLSEVYGYQVDPSEIINRAAQNGWLVYDGNGDVKGIYAQNISKIFASFGVASHEREGADGAWQALNDALANNERIVLSVDSKEIQAGQNVGDDTTPDWDHFVSVEGIDYTKGVVIINDSARSAGLEVPINVLYDAWHDSDFDMTVTDAPASQAAAGGSGYTLLGATVQLHAGAGGSPATAE
jgi:hypothetical protein